MEWVVLHVVGASLWLGGLASALASWRLLGAGAARRIMWVSMLGLGLLMVSGLVNAMRLGGPGEWFAMGTHVGRVGEKIVAWLFSGLLGGWAFSRLARGGLEGRGVPVALFLALVFSLGALYLGVGL